MPAHSAPAYGVTAYLVIAGAAIVFAAVCIGVKIRAASRRGFGVHVCDLGADVTLPRVLHSRSYQIALYLTMKSLPREPADATKVTSPAPTP